MNYADLTPYEFPLEENIKLLNIGRFDKTMPFTQGKTSQEFKEKLAMLIQGKIANVNIISGRIRGYYYCPCCPRLVDPPWIELYYFNDMLLNHLEIIIPSAKDDRCFYFTYGTIHHLVDCHDYLPPTDFIEAILKLNSSTAFDAESIYGA
ncbi:hypothetical protein [Bartonella sp. HY406]|uniref:DUF7919 family protein n=1 Tax=Bartonella sp. HY406 TaxID=2979331 RepID=UPI0021C99166|nr:hypothetical protein [Bartonella sp. HY406]UXN05000.1 hypothetical protein N6B01_14080 [Bartonella sp. HY406]